MAEGEPLGVATGEELGLGRKRLRMMEEQEPRDSLEGRREPGGVEVE